MTDGHGGMLQVLANQNSAKHLPYDDILKHKN